VSGRRRHDGAQRPAGATVTFKVHFRNGDKGRKRLRNGSRSRPPKVKPGRVPRISKLMALAIHFDDLIRKGVVRDYADLARLGGVSRARVSQIMDLLNLAPDIQEKILFQPEASVGRDSVTERSLRPITCKSDWSRQRVTATRILIRSTPDPNGSCPSGDQPARSQLSRANDGREGSHAEASHR